MDLVKMQILMILIQMVWDQAHSHFGEHILNVNHKGIFPFPPHLLHLNLVALLLCPVQMFLQCFFGLYEQSI